MHQKASKIASLESELYFYCHQDESVTQCSYFSGKLTEMTAWEKIVELYADEPLVQKTAKAGYARDLPGIGRQVQQRCGLYAGRIPASESGFLQKVGRELMRAQLYEKDIAICSRRSIHIFLEHLGKTKTG